MSKPPSRRRKERAHVHTRLRGVYFECLSLASKEFRAVNISESGIGLETKALRASLAEGATIEGQLTVGYTALNLKLKFVHFTPNTLGFEFVDLPQAMRVAIQVYFESEIVGASLKLVDHNGDGLKYEDQNSNGLTFILTKEKTLQEFNFFILGNQIRWTSTGQIHFIQNEMNLPLPESMRKQLVSVIQSAASMEPSSRRMIENILRYLPVDA